MAEPATLPTAELIDHATINAALELAIRDAVLEHARLGRSVCEERDGKVVWITPEEIFARYRLDENGKPPVQTGGRTLGKEAARDENTSV